MEDFSEGHFMDNCLQRALEVISFISRHLQDGHTGHAREIKDMLKKEWKERRLAQGEGGFRDTPLTLAIRQNKPDVAEVCH